MAGQVERKLKAELAEAQENLRAALELFTEDPSLTRELDIKTQLCDYANLHYQAYGAEVDGR